MKKGKYMQIPIQSLNTIHEQKYEFTFDGVVFKYNLSDEELKQISLVLESGETFEFPDDVIDHIEEKTHRGNTLKSSQRKRDNKHCGKQDQQKETIGIDVTLDSTIKHTKHGNILKVNRSEQEECMFKAEKGGSKAYVKYLCGHQHNCGCIIEKISGVYYLCV